MKILSAVKNELLGILHNRMLLISIIGVMTIPLLYSATYLWAFWDPYGHLERLPVAVVNNDQGAVYNGQKLTLGDDLVKQLKEKGSFKWSFVSEKQADQGLEDQDYYLKIEIPKDFSENATTLQSKKPQKLQLIYTANEGYNYLSSKIGDSAIEKIKEEVAAKVSKTYAESIFNNIKTAAKGFKQAGDGAGKLHNGINKAKKGSSDLNAGIGTAYDGTADVNKGAKDVDSGAKTMEKNLQLLAEKSVSFSTGLASASTGAGQLQDGLNQFASGLGQMQQGNAQLLAGSKKLETGASELSQGLGSATSKLPELETGSQQLADGASKFADSMEQWNQGAKSAKAGAANLSSGMEQVASQVSQMADSATDPVEKAKLTALSTSLQQMSAASGQVASGVGDLADKATLLQQSSAQLSAGAKKLNQGQGQLAGGISQLADGAKQLNEGQSQLTAGLETFGTKLKVAQTGFDQLIQGNNQVSSGLNQLSSGSVQLKDGTNQLAKGSEELADGTGKLAAGTSNLKDGVSQLADGSRQLQSGMHQLSSGSKELKNKLQKGAKDAGNVKANDSVYDMMAQPVHLKDSRIHHVPDYGTGFAPYFLSLSLFVGALVLSIIFPMFEPAAEPKSGISWCVGKLSILMITGVMQALLADVVLLKVLGLEVKSIPYFIMLSIFTSWTFFAIIQFLVITMNNPGRFIAIILLVLQLTSSAGTYPIELSPDFLNDIAHFLPMTYSVSGFRAVISTGDFGFMWGKIGALGIFFFIFFAGSLIFFARKYKQWSMSDHEGKELFA